MAFTFNGIGTTLLGSIRPSSLSTRYFARLFFTVLWIPIVPLGIYFVSSVDGRRFQFHGRIDARDFHSAYPARVLLRFYLVAFAVSIVLGVALVTVLFAFTYLGGLLGFHGAVRVRL